MDLALRIRRVRQIYQFLQALDQHRNPAVRQLRDHPWHLELSQLPEHSSIDFRDPLDEPGGGEASPAHLTVSETDEKGGEEPFLRVRRATTTNAPAPPDELEGWLSGGWNDPSAAFTMLELRTLDAESKPRQERFEESPDRVHAHGAWRRSWEQWAEAERPTRASLQVFERLYELHGHLNREAEALELIVGDGILNWRLSSGGLHHPILLQRVELRFDPSIPEFSVLEVNRPTELYSSVLRSHEVDGKLVAAIREEVEAGDAHPLQGPGADAFYRSVVTRLSARGEYLGRGAPRGEDDHPRIGRDPVLFLRRRSLGFASAIRQVLDSLGDREQLPIPLVRIVGIDVEADMRVPDTQPSLEPSSASSPGSGAPEVLFCLEANREQYQIAERLESSTSLVVQGPPGTGKTHTIANLIGHLLAHGQRILVTSHTAKALSVLRDQVPETLRPLCISDLGSDAESRRQLESAIENMVERLSGNAEALEALAESSTRERRRLLEGCGELQRQILAARSAEYREIVVAGRAYSPSDAARRVRAGEATASWIPSPIAAGEPLPLSPEELAELYRTNTEITQEEEWELSLDLPSPEYLVPIEELEELVRAKGELEQSDSSMEADLWEGPPIAHQRGAIEEGLLKLRELARSLDEAEPWRTQLMEIGARGPEHAEPWRRLTREIKLLFGKVTSNKEQLFRYHPELSKRMPIADQERIAREIRDHLEAGRKLGRLALLTHGEWKAFLAEARAEGGAPVRREHFQALMLLAGQTRQEQALRARWDHQAAPLGLPDSGTFSELPLQLDQWALLIDSALDWRAEQWDTLGSRLSELGLRWSAVASQMPPKLTLTPTLDGVKEIAHCRLPACLASRLHACRRVHLEEVRRRLESQFEVFASVEHTSCVVQRLLEQARNLDVARYRDATDEFRRLWSRRSIVVRRRELLERLGRSARAWAQAVTQRREQHGEARVPGDPNEAWLWSQLHQELEQRASLSAEDLQVALEHNQSRTRSVTRDLIEASAWAAQIRRTGLQHRQALVGWRDIVKRTPKTSTVPGRIANLRRAAQNAMRTCREAVPVWIMPLSRVVESFDFSTTKFDVAIIDEASQTDVMGLLVHYVAEKVLVVGDHEQVSPAAVGQNVETISHLISEHLQGIPNAILYDGKTSIYDLARQSSGGLVRLLEHFRCVPQIIQFCNDLSYSGSIKPLRDTSRARLRPFLVPYRVEGRRTVGKVNQPEAEAVASLIAACLERPGYRGKTLGVISMVGDQQALEIDRLIRNHLPVDVYDRHRIVCGNAAQFQGDERDVMFLSLVDVASDGPLPRRIQPEFRQRFNVAVSRARDQLWVVHSLDPQVDLKAGDLRRRLVEHALDPGALERKLDVLEQRVQSEFERLVAQRLARAGYRVAPQWRVGAYIIDLVVEGDEKRLAIECDGDRFHPPEKLASDMERQAILERLGWTFERIRGTAFFRDPEVAMARVFARLERMGIPPESGEASFHQDGFFDDLITEIKRRASDIRLTWADPETDAAALAAWR